MSKYCKRSWYWNILLSYLWVTGEDEAGRPWNIITCDIQTITADSFVDLCRVLQWRNKNAAVCQENQLNWKAVRLRHWRIPMCAAHHLLHPKLRWWSAQSTTPDCVSAKNASIFHSCFGICAKFCIHIPGRTNKSDNIGMETWVCEMSLEKLSPRTVSFTLASLNLSFPDTSQSYIPVSLRVTLLSLTLLLYIVTRLAYDSVEDVDNRDNLMKRENRFSLD